MRTIIKKGILLLIVITAAKVLTYGQVKFGVKSGINFSNNTLATSSESKTKIGYNGGLLAEISLGEKIILRPEFIYSLKGKRLSATQFRSKGSIHFHYANVPFLVGFKPVEKLTVLAGPELGYLMKAFGRSDGESRDVTWHYEKFDIGAILGIGYSLNTWLAAEMRYIYGFDGLTTVQEIDKNGMPAGSYKDGANRVFQIGINYFFTKK